MYKPYTPIRLIGLRMDNLEEKEKAQLSLLKENKDENKRKLIRWQMKLRINMDTTLLQKLEK